MLFLNFILICAVIGIIGAIISKLWESAEDFLGWLLSFFISGLGAGIFLFAIMGIGKMLGYFGDIYIFGIHPFWVGFVPLTFREIYLSLKTWLMSR